MSLQRQRSITIGYVSLCMLLLCVTTSAVAEEPYQLPEMSVIGEADEESRFAVDTLTTAIGRPGTAEMLKRAPGANVNFNGPLTGIAQSQNDFDSVGRLSQLATD